MMKQLLIAALFAFLFGGGMVVLFAHAVDKQQVVMQEGY